MATAQGAKKLQPIIIKRVQGGGETGHHGGAWKVAYADFVTAMMAFFLLMWLLNATTEKQRQGLAEYFDPTIAHSRSGGAAGVDGGRSLDPPADQSVSAPAGAVTDGPTAVIGRADLSRSSSPGHRAAAPTWSSAPWRR